MKKRRRTNKNHLKFFNSNETGSSTNQDEEKRINVQQRSGISSFFSKSGSSSFPGKRNINSSLNEREFIQIPAVVSSTIDHFKRFEFPQLCSEENSSPKVSPVNVEASITGKK